MIEFFIELLCGLIDPRLIAWVVVINIIGYWLKVKGLPKWCPPLPLLLFLISFVICTLFGWLVSGDLGGPKAAVMSIFFYGLGNGFLVAVTATWGYDIVHAIRKQRKAKESATSAESKEVA